jgi:RNA polymerase sigma-70 factor (ECF subfamily)
MSPIDQLMRSPHDGLPHATLGGQVELTQPIAEPLDLAETPLDDRLAIEARMDAQAFAPLYERHIERVYRYLRARGANDDAAAELTALTFERALSHIDRYRPGGSGFGPWLLRIARNAFIDAGRRQRSRSLDLDEVARVTDPGRSPEDAAIAAEERRWILSLVMQLPDVQRDALALRFAGGLSSREIATVIGKSEAATKKLLTRSLAALKEATLDDA